MLSVLVWLMATPFLLICIALVWLWLLGLLVKAVVPG
jgi:hypothetical protein